ncbi:DNA-3-methyladenine glycosylase I [Heterostelium album PN500]|uniref:DNA-3-methyladenine glycosylase I n=1 Tax=Heterostelium pallidum (strain ATCC 26659 / Pp 5 / PN500) TaxID=670386 RepID=D3BBY1_HETP5|nr:DNA-3-methyladenine glycosylase I [Heterostelium album PN500]EFA81164.1 DNA-3-methyladenine glycosylase I [Heterostelium album PN500]|eukprot:XP_020433282.1 DNA-3-methyladenine glycosylase I [Heterostelium album PN500]
MSNIVIKRCGWTIKDPIYLDYHDNEWGKPQRDRVRLFEMLSLGVTQCGLSWNIVFKRRDSYRVAFSQFNIENISKFTGEDIDRLMKNEQLIRHRGKLEAIVNNAKMVLELESKLKISFPEYLWGFVGDKPILNNNTSISGIPTKSDVSDKMAASLKTYGFKFTGTTICYAFMQTVGMINDHLEDCFCRVGPTQSSAAKPAARKSKLKQTSPIKETVVESVVVIREFLIEYSHLFEESLVRVYEITKSVYC